MLDFTAVSTTCPLSPIHKEMTIVAKATVLNTTAWMFSNFLAVLPGFQYILRICVDRLHDGVRVRF